MELSVVVPNTLGQVDVSGDEALAIVKIGTEDRDVVTTLEGEADSLCGASEVFCMLNGVQPRSMGIRTTSSPHEAA